MCGWEGVKRLNNEQLGLSAAQQGCLSKQPPSDAPQTWRRGMRRPPTAPVSGRARGTLYMEGACLAPRPLLARRPQGARRQPFRMPSQFCAPRRSFHALVQARALAAAFADATPDISTYTAIFFPFDLAGAVASSFTSRHLGRLVRGFVRSPRYVRLCHVRRMRTHASVRCVAVGTLPGLTHANPPLCPHARRARFSFAPRSQYWAPCCRCGKGGGAPPLFSPQPAANQPAGLSTNQLSKQQPKQPTDHPSHHPTGQTTVLNNQPANRPSRCLRPAKP